MTLRAAASTASHGDAGLRGRQRRSLRAALDLEDLLHLVGRLAEHERAADVRLVAFDAAAAVDQQDRALADRPAA